MLRDVFYYGKKPNVHPREQYAKNLVDARKKATTEHFWVINEFCDYTEFDWDFDFEFLPDEDVWAENHNNVWPSTHQKDSGTWLCAKQRSDVIVYRADVTPLKRKNVKNSNWKILENIDTDKWDFSWHPDPTDPPYIYKWGCKYFPVEFKSCIEYHVDGATQVKYMSAIVELLPNYDCIVETQKVDTSRWDMSWRPDPLDPPYIYVWGNKYIDGRLRSTLEYHTPGATEKKYMPEFVPVLPEWDRWEILHDVEKTTFDFCWRPDPREPDFIYVFGNEQYDSTVMPTIEYRMPNATVKKYITDVTAKLSAHPEKFEHLEKADGIDYSWVPDPTAPPYIYAWGNQWNKPQDKISIQYVVEGATEYKYMDERATRKPCLDNWSIPEGIDYKNFDYSWEPSPADPPFIYQFGTQWQKTGGPRYHVEGATEIKYVTTQTVKKLANKKRFAILNNLTIQNFDYSWHPDDTDEPYIYVFGNNQYPAEIMPTIEYVVPGATQIKYINDVKATLGVDKNNWEIPEFLDTSEFDFSWKPNPKDPALIYQFGTQWQKTGGPRYVTPDACDVKYVESPRAIALSNKDRFTVLDDLVIADFDYSWHPDTTEEPYIYQFGNSQYPAEIMPTIEYVVEGATQIKYVSHIKATLGVDMNNWVVPDNIDTSEFDFSWKPNPKDPPFIYQFGTQWQKTGGPRYVVPDATEVKYITTQQAKALPTIELWEIPNNLDITGFDFSWHPDDTSPPYVYHFATQWALTGGPIYRMPNATETKYLDEPSAIALPNKENWEVPKNIDITDFDFSWHPYVEDQPYVYQFGTQWQKTGGPRYVTPGVIPTSPVKYIDTRILKSKKLPSKKHFATLNNYKIKGFDYSWHPDDTEEPYIYVFGNNQYPAEIMPTIEYVVPGATQIKYVSDVVAILDVDMTNWEVPDNIDTSEFDFSWKPNPKDPPFIYQFGTQWQKTGGPRYVVADATEVKYVTTQEVKALVNMSNWTIPPHVDVTNFDFSWHPDDTSPPYIYHFATQWALTGGPVYTVPGATEGKYLEEPSAVALPNKDNWEIPNDIDSESFDYSWHPYVEDQPYVYIFGTQWQKTGGPKYMTPGVIPTSPVKYIDTRILKAKKLANKKNFAILNNYKIKDFDFSWHPDETEEPYIYVFGNTQHPAEVMPTIEYVVPGAKQIKYVSDIVAVLDQDMSNWEVPENLDTTEFDFSWKPNPKDPAYIYEFGTQHQKTGGPRYVVPDATEIKYVSTQQAKALPTTELWELPSNIDVTGFDFSWHPDNTSPPYIYNFATQWALSGGPVYRMPNATEVKYMDHPSAIALANKDNWEIPSDIDEKEFDFSWHPYVEDQPYIYQFGTQWQKTGGPRYVTPGVIPTSPVKYIDTRILKAKRKPNKRHFSILGNYKIESFDYSWHPDDTDEPYIYLFGNTQYPPEVMPTIEYAMPGAKQIKYVSDVVVKLAPDMTNWEVPKNVDITGFDFSWKPNPNDPPYIYQFGTQWQKTGGPKYIVEGATQVKYVDTMKVKALPTQKNWSMPADLIIDEFDYSWHPDATEEPYVYQFGTQWALTGGPKYIVEGAMQIKYMDINFAKVGVNMKNWIVPQDTYIESFDYSWHPHPDDPPFIYVFGTQWYDRGGPKYMHPLATEMSPLKYIDTRIIKATLGVNKTNWKIPKDIDINDFDFSWVPHPEDPTFIYQFGTQHQKTGGPRYVPSEATDKTSVKYVTTLKAKKLPNKNNFNILNDIEIIRFDYSWHPDDTEEPYIYVFGNNKYTAEVMPTVEYVVPGATKTKYVSNIVAVLKPDRKLWKISDEVDVDNFDFSWIPDPNSPPYIYVFGNQWNPAVIEPTIEYVVPSATDYKYVDDIVATVLPNKNKFNILHPIIESEFDFSWRPNPKDPPYKYVFGNNLYPAEVMPTVEYVVDGSTQVKYITDIVAKLGVDKTNWVITQPINEKTFDFSWRPNPKDPPYIYRWGNKYISNKYKATIEYIVPGATDIKYMTDDVEVLPEYDRWQIPKNLDTSEFDFTWRPDPLEPDLIWEFGTQHQKTGGPRYVVEGATEIKYIDKPKARILPNSKNYIIPEGIDVSRFDFSWHPDDTEPKYIYQFGTILDKNDGPTYQPIDHNNTVVYKLRVELSDEELARIKNAPVVPIIDIPQYYIETTLDDLVNKHSNEVFWALNKNLDYSNFDFSWRPEIIEISWESDYIHVFGSPDSELTQTYFVNAKQYLSGKKDFKFVEQKTLDTQTLATMFKKPSMFFVDRSNPESQKHFEQLKSRFPDIQKTRYLNTWVDTINRCINRSSTELCWILNSELDYSDFNFEYYPNPWQMKMVHVFGTQWSHWGTTFIVNKESFPTDTKYIKIIEHLSNLNFVKDRTAKATSVVHDIVYIDHGNTEPPTDGIVVKYEKDYLTTFKTILSKLPQKKEHYVWIKSSVCDYENFDFTYICDPFAREQLHVFPSDKQKFGDTFFVNVNKLRELVDSMETLKDYDKINYNQHQRVKRLEAPTITTPFDTHVGSVLADFDFPYAVFITEDNKDIKVVDDEPMSLWDIESKNILITSTGGTRIIVPKEAKDYVETQLYDYPYIKTASRLAKSNPLDIVFLSNGEACADENYEHLLQITKGLPNRIVRVDGVKGRVQAYHAAAEASNTPWMLTVFAKLKVNAKFDFNWQPDRLQIPKHYMFLAKNPVNGLIYGHQGMIAYNKEMTLANEGHGLDFTLDSPHETIEILSGTAMYNTDAWSTWRTAFREVIKLKKDGSEISLQRLDAWLTKGDGEFGSYSIDGAVDGIAYFDKVKGKVDKLRLSYEWDWLKKQFNKKYKKK